MINPLDFLSNKMKDAAIIGLVIAVPLSYGKAWLDRGAHEDAKANAETVEQFKKRNEINEDVDELDDCDLIVELGGVCD